MKTRSRGMTFVGFLILLAFLGVFVYGGIRLVPVYLEYMNVAKAVDAVRSDAGLRSQDAIRRAIEKRFDIDDVHSITAKDIEIKHEGNGWTVHAGYDATAPFLGNVEFLVHFDKFVTVSDAAGP